MQVYNGIDIIRGMAQDSNIYLVEGEILVDTGTGRFFSDVKDYIQSKYDRSKIKMIVNTHCHFDHSGANKKFRDWLKASIAIHADDKHAVESGAGTLAEFFNDVSKTATVEKILNQGSKIKTANFVFEVIHTPGHTPGSICLYESNKRILVCGDLLFDGAIGRTDLPGGDATEMLKSLKKLLNYDISCILPGHGPPRVGGVSFLIKQMIEHYGEKRFINYEYY